MLLASGELELATAADLETSVDATLQRCDVDAVVLDCAGLVFVDGAGLGALVRCRASLDDHARTFAVRNPAGSWSMCWR